MAISRQASDKLDRSVIRTVGSEHPAKTYTYRQSADKSHRFVNHLVEADIERGDCMAIHTTQHLEVIVAHLATWKLGSIPIVLNPLLGTSETPSRWREREPPYAC